MSQFQQIGGDDSLSVHTIDFPDFDVSWAGLALPWWEGFCFGSEDGRVWFTKYDGPKGHGPIDIAKSKEAINGVAFTHTTVAASTRREVAFWSLPVDEPNVDRRITYEGGAHGVVSTRSECFIAPLGRKGLLLTNQKRLETKSTMVVRMQNRPTDFYKVTSLGSFMEPPAELLVSACRKSGIVTMVLPHEDFGGFASTLNFPTFDAVDVCGLHDPYHPGAAAALGIDRSVHLIRDVLRPNNPPTIRFPGLEGTAYRIFASDGHIFMLTSEWLYAIKDLAKRFLYSERPDGWTVVKALPMQAVDAFLAGPWIIAILPEGVRIITIRSLIPEQATEEVIGRSNGSIRNSETQLIEMPWQDIPNASLDFATV